ncbi:MAG: dynamin family protein [Paracoccaceae bacterium]
MSLDPAQIRKPRIALMGEFSAGKSTLSNLLLGQRVLPEKVTATRLPPVWMQAGTDAPSRVSVDGRSYPVDLKRLEDVPLEETLYVRLCFEAEVLDHCDLMDFPGISDPNMSSEIWERMLGEVDGVLWCTHATQAWRQSEAAAWEMIPERVRRNSLLLITRIDKLTTDRDKERVQKRLARETAGLFAAICPISLTQALAAGQDEALLQASGAEGFFAAMTAAVENIAAEPAVERPALTKTMDAPEIHEFASTDQNDAEPAEEMDRFAEAEADFNLSDAADEAAEPLLERDDAEPAMAMADEAQAADEIDRDEVSDEPETFAEPENRAEPETAAEPEMAADAGSAPGDNVRILPRRVRPTGVARTARPGSATVTNVVLEPNFNRAPPTKSATPEKLREMFHN